MSVTTQDFLRSISAEGPPSDADRDRLLELLWESWGSSVFAFTFSLTSNREEAADACQETFVNALKGIPGMVEASRDSANLRGWLFKIARNVVAYRARRPSRVTTFAALGSADDEQALSDRTADEEAPDPAGQTVLKEELGVLRDCVAELSDRLRRVIELVDLQERSRAEVQEVLGWTDVNLRVALHKGRKHLRKCVELRTGELPEEEAQ
jgi:RNA polymerase sigma-70 factor (ECF subfamily)